LCTLHDTPSTASASNPAIDRRATTVRIPCPLVHLLSED
jgi:hypothetical protein